MTLAANTDLRTLTTYEQCAEAIEAIESDYGNVAGGLRAWNSGTQTHLTASAARKVVSIQAKMTRMTNTRQEWQLGVRSELQPASYEGWEEYGEQPHRVAYFIIATSPSGEQCAHDAAFDNNEDAETLCGTIKSKLKSGATLDDNEWRRIEPAYGSEAYVNSGGDRTWLMGY